MSVSSTGAHRSGLAFPRQGGELVDGGDQEGREAPIDRLIDGEDWERTLARKFAGSVDAADLKVGRPSNYAPGWFGSA